MASLQLSGRDVQILLCELAAGAERYRAQDDSLSPAIAEQRDDLRGRLLAAIAGDREAPEMVLPDTAACKADADTIRSLEAAREKLRDQVARQDRQIGHLMNDGDRREQAALDRARDCAEHGRMLAHWERLASWHWAANGQQENIRRDILSLADSMRGHLDRVAGPVPADLVRRWMDECTGHASAQRKARRQPEGWPPLEEYMHAGCACSAAAGSTPAPRQPETRPARRRPVRSAGDQQPLDLCVPGVIP